MSIVEEENMHFHILGIISRQATKGDVTSEIFRTLITEVHLREGNIRACGVSNLLRLVELEE